jgi:hypothetical protein
MNLVLDIILALAIIGWLAYAVWKIHTSYDPCAGCALAGFECRPHQSSCVRQHPMEYRTKSGHAIIIDEAAAKARRERIQRILNQNQ